ncbi:RDD family protein [Spiroplasma taiwanense]|uniref:RDD domain-containing protein n=1 Tax=Spiroplasma taiwanense CT-1 TaxID=1276220 RepID=S5LYP8_9MOLU|nr:RDD family protein [Spiroplasma taiwanense]AGR40792.1 hypothetical protein STAIW_v1c01020 [Spiroplasma taiwanense CT-1]
MVQKNLKLKKQKNSSYNLVKPHLGRIFFARLFDLILCSIPNFILLFFYKISDWQSALINISVSQIFIFLYFVIIPFLLKGNTIGKKLFHLKLVNIQNQKIKISNIFLRELYFLYIPLLFQLVCQIISIIIFANFSPGNNNQNENGWTIANIIQNIGYTFCGIWFLYIPLTIYLQKDKLSSIDLKLKLRVFFLEKILVKNQKVDIEGKKVNHIHLENDLPGNVNIKEIEKLIGENNE